MKKANKNTKKFLPLLSVIGLVVLLLLSPCKVRNTIQAAFGATPTQVSNKSIALSAPVCSVSEEVSSQIASTKHPSFTFQFLLPSVPLSVVKLPDFSNQSFANNAQLTELVPIVPYYILYRKLKLYS